MHVMLTSSAWGSVVTNHALAYWSATSGVSALSRSRPPAPPRRARPASAAAAAAPAAPGHPLAVAVRVREGVVVDVVGPAVEQELELRLQGGAPVRRDGERARGGRAVRRQGDDGRGRRPDAVRDHKFQPVHGVGPRLAEVDEHGRRCPAGLAEEARGLPVADGPGGLLDRSSRIGRRRLEVDRRERALRGIVLDALVEARDPRARHVLVRRDRHQHAVGRAPRAARDGQREFVRSVARPARGRRRRERKGRLRRVRGSE